MEEEASAAAESMEGCIAFEILDGDTEVGLLRQSRERTASMRKTLLYVLIGLLPGPMRSADVPTVKVASANGNKGA